MVRFPKFTTNSGVRYGSCGFSPEFSASSVEANVWRGIHQHSGNDAACRVANILGGLMHLPQPKILLAALLCAAGFVHPCPAQVAPATILEIDVQNVVRYYEDTTDPTKFATVPGVVPATVTANFQTYVLMGDIVAVNGQPARGTVSHTARWTNLTPTPTPGQAIADMIRGGLGQWAFEIQGSDGTPIGTLFLSGMHGGSRTPGSPLEVTQGNNAITGGTGAFFGARGDFGQQVTAQTIAVRAASITEDPANRRKNGGGLIRWVFHVIPLSAPQVAATASGPAIVHSSDFSPVTASKPAAAGEILSVFANGLGPTILGVDPGQPFPGSPLQAVSSPVGVTVNGKPAEVLAAVGFPGTVDGYQVNFRVPSDASKGSATIQLSAAWISGPSVSMPIQ
jgi:hypothetical protein